MLELRNLAKHYPTAGGETVRAVDDVSLQIAAGETVVLYGPSGSGKTTLLMMIAMLLAPSAGSVLIGERDVCTLSEREASRFRLTELGFIHQGSDLLPGVSTIDNAVLKLLATMRWRDARREVTPLLESLGLGERLEHRSETLSTGERQRVMIARALSTKPRLLLADEPTGSLDSRRGGEVLDLLRRLSREQDVALVLVSHDPAAARYADRVFALHDGKLTDWKSQRSGARLAREVSGGESAPTVVGGRAP
ncbi:MAG TPA: ABC transporter ATP-binding protein [Solirubrobacteraceae bacterium]|jgi:ABC-type lipoprotein export system ATPase subunit|nr:ABC transporter ATP-binding protein [Solirubrobacteraceae bacterium]